MIGLFAQLFPIVVIIYSVISKLNIIINFSVVKICLHVLAANFFRMQQ